MSGSARPLVSVVLSFRNEAENIPTLVSRLASLFAGQDVDYELVFVNDDSTDGSLATLLQERERNARVKIVNMSRRLGEARDGVAGWQVTHSCTGLGPEAADLDL